MPTLLPTVRNRALALAFPHCPLHRKIWMPEEERPALNALRALSAKKLIVGGRFATCV
jgi:hypothetical protein